MKKKVGKIAGNVEDIGLFRYSLIVPAINETFIERSMNEYFINVASKEHTLPNGTKKIFSVNSIKSWYYQYKKYGFDALKQGSRKTNEQIDENFLHRIERCVKSDSTISLNTELYEVPQQFIKKKIIVKYNPENMEELYIYNDKNERIHTIKPVDKISNSKYKRQETINLYREEQGKNV